MEALDTLTDTLRRAMLGYAGKGLNAYSYLTSSDDQRVFAVVTIARVRDQRIVDAGLIARIVGEKIVVECDNNNKPLVDALVQAGVPREHIVLAYAGEPVADAA